MVLIEIMRGMYNERLTAEEFRIERWSSKMSISESISTGKLSSIAVLVSVLVSPKYHLNLSAVAVSTENPPNSHVDTCFQFPFSSFLAFPSIFSRSLFAASFRTMKALFDRYNRAHSNDKVKDPWDPDSYPDSDSDWDSPFVEETSPQSSELSLTPSPLEQPHHSITASTSITWYKPPPEPSLPPIEVTLVDQDSAGRSSRKIDDGSITTTNGSNDTPPPSGFNADRPLPEDTSTSNNGIVVHSQPSDHKDPRGSMFTAASGSRPDVGSSKNSTQTVKALVTSPYSAKPAYGDGVSIHQYLRSGTPSSQKSIGSVLPPASWSEAAEEDLVAHIGPRERARQEVLWEIVASEERCGFYLCLFNKTINCPADMSPSCSK